MVEITSEGIMPTDARATPAGNRRVASAASFRREAQPYDSTAQIAGEKLPRAD
jgi:hypothetical protein